MGGLRIYCPHLFLREPFSSEKGVPDPSVTPHHCSLSVPSRTEQQKEQTLESKVLPVSSVSGPYILAGRPLTNHFTSLSLSLCEIVYLIPLYRIITSQPWGSGCWDCRGQRGRGRGRGRGWASGLDVPFGFPLSRLLAVGPDVSDLTSLGSCFLVSEMQRTHCPCRNVVRPY